MPLLTRNSTALPSGSVQHTPTGLLPLVCSGATGSTARPSLFLIALSSSPSTKTTIRLVGWPPPASVVVDTAMPTVSADHHRHRRRRVAPDHADGELHLRRLRRSKGCPPAGRRARLIAWGGASAEWGSVPLLLRPGCSCSVSAARTAGAGRPRGPGGRYRRRRAAVGGGWIRRSSCAARRRRRRSRRANGGSRRRCPCRLPGP